VDIEAAGVGLTLATFPQRLGVLKGKKRTPITLDDTAMKSQADFERAKGEARKIIAKIEAAQRPTWEKVVDKANQVGRQVLLSSLQTLGKLTGAGAMRNVSAPLENLIIAGFRQFVTQS
jgi:hypothetical protein